MSPHDPGYVLDVARNPRGQDVRAVLALRRYDPEPLPAGSGMAATRLVLGAANCRPPTRKRGSPSTMAGAGA
jgi:hypothetical protein